MTKIIFMGTPDFSVPVLKQIIKDGFEVIGVITQPDRPVGRKKVLTPPTVKVEAMKQGIPVFQPEKIRQKQDLDKILALNPDLIITAAFGQILPKELLEAPKYGCVNVHASLLPELRGGAPIQYALLQGKKKTGITIMYMAEKLDAGDIIKQVEIPISEEDTLGTLHDKLSEAGAKLLSETLPPLLAGELTAIPQDEEHVTFAPTIKRSEEKIDWGKTGEEIYNHIRALNPYPGAYTLLDGKILKLWKAEKSSAKPTADPGTIVGIESDRITVAAGKRTSVVLKELQPSGKKKMSVADFLRGAGSHISTGFKLGDLHE